jgi:tRNA(Arg) A34 adenosine deaminase TadA
MIETLELNVKTLYFGTAKIQYISIKKRILTRISVSDQKQELFLVTFLNLEQENIKHDMTNDRELLGMAIKIAGDGIKTGAGPFGAVITLNGDLIASSNNRVVLDSDPTAHAEILAIRKAAGILRSHDLSGCVLYTSCEPCPMCLGAIYWAGIKKVVYSALRHDAASAGFSDDFIYNEIALDPSERKVTFIRVKDPEAGEVFRMWENFEDRIKY